MLGLDVRFLHDNGAYTPYGIIVPIITSTQLLGPYKPGAYRVEFHSLYTNTVHRHAVPGCRPAARRVRDGADHGRDRRPPRPGPGRGAGAQPDPARRDALRPRADLPGRPAADLRLRRLPGVAAQGAEELVDWDDFAARARTRRGPRAGGSASGWPAYVEGTGVGPYEGAHVRVETTGEVVVATGLTTQGQGHETVFAQIAARGAGRADRAGQCDHRGHPAVRLRRWARSPRGPR